MNFIGFIKASNARRKLPTPHYFVVLGKRFKQIGIPAAALIAAASLSPGMADALAPIHIVTACQYIVAMSIVGVSICAVVVADQTGADV